MAIHIDERDFAFFRTMIVQMALTIEAIEFPSPGLCTVELICNNEWVADTTLLLK